MFPFLSAPVAEREAALRGVPVARQAPHDPRAVRSAGLSCSTGLLLAGWHQATSRRRTSSSQGREAYPPSRQRGRGGPPRRKRYRPDWPQEQERQRRSVQVPDGWGKRADGLKEPWKAPWYKKRLARGEIPLQGMESEMKSLDREPIRDFGDMLENREMPNLSQNPSFMDQNVDEVLMQSQMTTVRSRYQAQHPSQLKLLERNLFKDLPKQEWPSIYPHFRKASDWDDRQAEAEDSAEGEAEAAPRRAPSQFFSRRSWEEIDGLTDETTSLARSMQLPRPSRIQYQSIPEVANGRNVVIADQSGSGKTLAYLLPLIQRHVLPTDPDDRRVRIIVVAPTSDLVQQIAEVARVASARSGRSFHVTTVVGGGGANAKQQRWRLQQGSEVVVATPGRLKFFMEEDYVVQKDTWQHVKALVIDEVDTLVGEDSPNPMFDLKAELPADLQWVFVTATVSEAAKKEIRMLKGQLQGEANDLGVRKDGQIVWTRGPGLHRVPQNCEHVLVDCTPKSLYNLPNSARLDAVMKAKIGALAWHLDKGVLCEESDNRVMIFCNTISNCSRVYEALDERNPDDERSGGKQWKLLVLHGLRDKKEYQRNMDLFSTEKVPAADFFKRRILICTDRLSRGMDFGSNPVKWVVLLDWPRDATEYLRRVGRTARADKGGSVLTLLCGPKEARMGKQITAAAIRCQKLTTKGADFEERVRCLERFDPTTKDWRAKRAAAPKPVWKRTPADPALVQREEEAAEEDQRELTEKELREFFQEENMGSYDDDVWDDLDDSVNEKEEDEMRDADEGWAPWDDEEDEDYTQYNGWDSNFDSPFDEDKLGISLKG